MRYPHAIRVERAGEITGSDPDTGAPVYAPPVVLYDGEADVQDVGEVLDRDPEGTPTERSDATVFLADETALPTLEKGMTVHIDWRDGTTDDATIAKVRRMDGTLLVRYV